MGLFIGAQCGTLQEPEGPAREKAGCDPLLRWSEGLQKKEIVAAVGSLKSKCLPNVRQHLGRPAGSLCIPFYAGPQD